MDVEKAFDSVNRQVLWDTLYTHGMRGRFFDVLKSMYESVGCCVKCVDGMNDFLSVQPG